ncbi:MAG: DUF4262 domain-containing protein [Acidimicrobiales bacterium]
MCMRCDGYSWEEIERHTDLVIRVHGFTTVHVEGPSPWTYTIGAYESWDQPELLVVDIEASIQKALVHAIAEDYADFGEVGHDTLDLLDVELAPVDESHFDDGLVAAWEGRYSLSAAAGDFVQVVPGRSWFGGGAGRVRRLDRPRSRPGAR